MDTKSLLLMTVLMDLIRLSTCDFTDGWSPKPWTWFAPQPTGKIARVEKIHKE